MLEQYQLAAGHKTDEDVDAARRQILRDVNINTMPTTGQHLAVCGSLRNYRERRRAL